MALANFKSSKFKFSKEAARVSHGRFGVLLRVVRAEHQNQKLRRIPFYKKRLLKRPFQTNLHQGLSVDIKIYVLSFIFLITTLNPNDLIG
jgi:hypothetical protein